ncbi:MAG TPA: hypothetical protein DCQ31_16745 [Bacteroidales bacterium]|nr:hypothetical protein [Bacteroidales bacterium]
MPNKLHQTIKLLSAKTTEAKLLLLIFYSVGIIGLSNSFTHSLFLKLIPLALLLSVLVLIPFHAIGSLKKIAAVYTFIYTFSFIIEVLGVNYGTIFGQYQYGAGLGIKLFNTPLIIGLNWLMLVYVSASVFDLFRMHVLLKIVLASASMVLYDILLEMLAPALDMWNFSSTQVPIKNYISWFIISLFLHSILRISGISLRNKLAFTVFVVQFLFFAILLFIL